MKISRELVIHKALMLLISRLLFPTYRIRPRADPSGHVHVQRGAPACGNHPYNNGSVVARACHSYKERADAYAFADTFFFLYSCLSSVPLRGKGTGRKRVKRDAGIEKERKVEREEKERKRRGRENPVRLHVVCWRASFAPHIPSFAFD